jgi:hypothetical protein
MKKATTLAVSTKLLHVWAASRISRLAPAKSSDGDKKYQQLLSVDFEKFEEADAWDEELEVLAALIFAEVPDLATEEEVHAIYLTEIAAAQKIAKPVGKVRASFRK